MTEDHFEADTQEHPVPQKTARDLPRVAQWPVLVVEGAVVGALFGVVAGSLGLLLGL